MTTSEPLPDVGTNTADSLRNGTAGADWPPVPQPCPWCSGPWNKVYHSGVCPRVRAIEYHPNGTVKRIEFRSPEGASPHDPHSTHAADYSAQAGGDDQ